MKDVSQVHADQGVRRAAFSFTWGCRAALSASCAPLRSASKTSKPKAIENDSADRARGGVSASDVVIEEEGARPPCSWPGAGLLVTATMCLEGRSRVPFFSHSFDEPLVGQRLQRGCALGNEDEERLFRVEGGKDGARVVRVDVRDEGGGNMVAPPLSAQSFKAR